MVDIRRLERELWESADLLRSNSKLTSQEYCMPVLGLIFLRYAFSRYQFVEQELMKDRPVRNGRMLPIEPIDFRGKSAIYLPEEARYSYLLNLPEDTSIGEKVNEAMRLIEDQSEQLRGILPKTYTIFQNDLLRELLRIFNNSALNNIQDDVIGRIYEYFLNKFAPAIAADDGVFFTPKSLVRMIGPRLRLRRDVCQLGGFYRPVWGKGKPGDDVLRPRKGGLQRQAVPDEHGGAWAERPHRFRRRRQQLLSRRF